LDPMGKCSNAFFSETTNMIKAKLYMKVYWMVLYNLKACRSRHFEFHIGTKNLKIVEDHPINIHVQFGFNHICSFWEEGIWIFLWEKCFKMLLLWNHLDSWNQTAQEWSLGDPLQGVCFLCRSENPTFFP
jgi:hypothetical protein